MSFLKKAQQHVAHTSKLPALGNQDLRQLQDVITAEKAFIQSNTKAATDFKKNAEAIKAWSAEEGPDLDDVAGKVSLLYDHYAASQNRLNSHLSTVRLHFKSIRTREESLANLKSRKRSLGSDIEKVERKLAKMGPENKELMKVTSQLKDMRGEMEGLHIEVMNEEAAIGDFKRRTVREALGIKSGALLEMAEKLTIVAEISKLMLDEIPLQPTQPGMPRAEYYGFAKTESLLQEATRAIADVGFNPTGPSAGIPRFGDLTLADTTADGSRGGDLSRSYVHNDAVDAYHHDLPATHASSADVDPDTGYTPSADRVRSTDEAARTPIYAQHASRSQWAHDGSAAPEHPVPDASTSEWAQSSYDRAGTSTASAAAAAAMAATAGADLNAVPGHGDGQDGGFSMQNSQSYTGSAGGLGAAAAAGPYGSNRNSADYHSAQGGHHVAGATEATVTGGAPSTEGGHQSDAYDGYTTGAVGASPQAQHDVAENATAGTLGAPMLGAPTLPPLRTATPLNGSTAAAQATVTSPTSYAAANAATDDSAYFQSIGSTRAMQEAVRRPISPAQNANCMSSYGALGAGASPQQPGGAEGKKVTAAAFRRGFSRNPSSQASMSAQLPPSATGASIYDDAQPQQPWSTSHAHPLPQPPALHANLATPAPPGAYLSSTTPDGSEHHSIPPLHIQKRNSNSHNPLGAAAAAGTPGNMLGRRYSNELGVSAQEYPAPPYGGAEQEGYAQRQPLQRNHSSQYAEYAAPPPPGYGYA
ncbi:related to LSP1-primary component of eisosomes [Sporisorium reilianum f. sp. reilianum]|uniref:Related to LSP1-primary component of eisosomes n=1 Tax=Sporisorium reilianum f. sp. reilianum TaxID=72559 RepID=A0A2N8UNB1_9BASI|nr:related to LSP1-primary component of eisosomes [Sporisorium reilianum f. sp. reilianum]